jgi:hypothetical protein
MTSNKTQAFLNIEVSNAIKFVSVLTPQNLSLESEAKVTQKAKKKYSQQRQDLRHFLHLALDVSTKGR